MLSFLQYGGFFFLLPPKLFQKQSGVWLPSDSPPANTQAIIPSVSVNRPLTDGAGGGHITIVFPPIDLCKYWSSLEVLVKISSLCSWLEAFFFSCWSHFWPKEQAGSKRVLQIDRMRGAHVSRVLGSSERVLLLLFFPQQVMYQFAFKMNPDQTKPGC